MSDKRVIRIIASMLYLILLTSCSIQSNHTATPETPSARYPAENDYTLLEQMSCDLNGDRMEEKIELYTSASVAADGLMGWDDGNWWRLVVHQGEQQYPLLNERIQNGEVDFWVIATNSKELEAPDPEDLTTSVYVIVTEQGMMRVLCFTWDEESQAYTEEIAFKPSRYWEGYHRGKIKMPLSGTGDVHANTAAPEKPPLQAAVENDYTLLEQMSCDLNGDRIQEKIELYTSAFVAADGFMRWNDGDTWTLVVHREEQQYPLLNERIQNGEVDFWVIKLNSKELDNPAPEDVTTGIYVAVTSERELRILCFTWDEESRSYTEEIAFTPPHSWAVRHANKYVLPLTVYAEERQV